MAAMPYRSRGVGSPESGATPARLILRPENSRVFPAVRLIAFAGVIYDIVQRARGRPGSAELLVVCFVALAASLYVHVTRVVFEIDGGMLRGYRLKLGIRTRVMEHPIDDVCDIGLRMRETHNGTATSVVLIRKEGPPIALSYQLFLSFSPMDRDLLELRSWFVEQRYGGSSPADLSKDLLVLFE